MKRLIRLTWTAFTVMCLICIFSQDVKAEEKTGSGNQTETSTVKDKSFNKKKKITIKKSEIYSKTNQYIWISYQPKSDGYLTITAKNAGGVPANGYLTLYNQAKNVALSSKSIAYSGKNSSAEYWTKNVFGLRKGVTYYIRIKAFTPVTLKSSFKKVTDKSGTMQSNALNVNKNKTKTGLILAGVSTPGWYKVTLTKPQKIKLHYNIHTKGSIRLSIYSDTRRLASKILYSQGAQKMTIALEKTDSTGKKTSTSLNKGTYYFKIEPANNITSGYYSFKWK